MTNVLTPHYHTNVALIGCGPHAKRIYVGYFSSHGLQPALIVDIASEKSKIEKLVSDLGWETTERYYVNPSDIYDAHDGDERSELSEILKNSGITKAIISTPPEVHVPYAELCLELGIKVLVDKPLSAPSNVSVGNHSELLDDFKKLSAYDTGDNIVVQCQRRRHDGYRYVKSLIDDMKKTYGVEPHFIDIYHSDGRWDFPDEIAKLKNHPYDTGYGKLLHSGYHFVDLLAFLTASSDYQTYDVFAYRNSIHDFKHQLPDEFYKKHFDLTNEKTFPDAGFGEIDSYSMIQLKKDGRVATTAALNLLHTGFSRRAWGNAKEDLYKGNGRLRHERVNIQIGPLMNIQIHSYQSSETHNDDSGKHPNEWAGLEHFDIHIFRNKDLIGGKPYELLTIDDIQSPDVTVGQNENARYQLVKDFLNDVPSGSALSSHLRTNILLAAICESTHTEERVKGAMSL